MFEWFKKLRKIVRNYDSENAGLHARMKGAENAIKAATVIDVDVGFSNRRMENNIIVSGVYRGKAHIDIFTVHTDDFKRLVEILKDMERYGNVRRIDAPQTVKATFEREFRNI